MSSLFVIMVSQVCYLFFLNNLCRVSELQGTDCLGRRDGIDSERDKRFRGSGMTTHCYVRNI